MPHPNEPSLPRSRHVVSHVVRIRACAQPVLRQRGFLAGHMCTPRTHVLNAHARTHAHARVVYFRYSQRQVGENEGGSSRDRDVVDVW